jgi:hypothetical protein
LLFLGILLISGSIVWPWEWWLFCCRL